MDNMQIFRQPDQQSAAAEAGENLNQTLVDNKKSPILLLLSAGSALGILDYVGESALGPNLTISVLDERFSQDPEINNFLLLQKTDFYTRALEAEASFFGTLPRDGETPEDLRQRWDKNLKTWRKENPAGLILATLGIGTDGHTAGIFPFPEDPGKFKQLFESAAWTAACDAGGKHKFPNRVTTTLTFFSLVDFGFAYVCGPDKKPKLDELLTGNKKPAVLPAAGWQNIKQAKIFTDLN